MKSIGIILITLGIALMLITGINIITKKEVVDLGKVEITKENRDPVRWSPLVGGIILAAGVIVLMATRKKVA